MPEKDWNPRFLFYCQSRGLTPEQTLAADEKRYPGGKMTGFILWSGNRLAEFKRAHPEAWMNSHLIDHAAYDAWLKNKVEKGEATHESE